MQGNSSVIATIVVCIVIVAAFVGYAFYANSSSLSPIYDQNVNLKQQLSGVSQKVSNLNQQVSILNQQVSTLEQRTMTVVTVSNTVFMVETTTSVVTLTSIHTSTVYPVPDNVTVLFTKVSGGYNYAITACSTTYTGSDDSQMSIRITPVFQGETITISASLTGLMGCSMGQTVTAELLLNGQVMSQGTEVCTGSNIQISYTI